MVLYSLGSVANVIQNTIPNVPASVSGAQLLDVVDRQRLFIEERSGLTVGSTGIAERFQPCLLNLSLAEVLPMIHLIGGDTNIGEVRVGMSALQTAQYYRELGMKQLNEFGKKIQFYKALG